MSFVYRCEHVISTLLSRLADAELTTHPLMIRGQLDVVGYRLQHPAVQRVSRAVRTAGEIRWSWLVK